MTNGREGMHAYENTGSAIQDDAGGDSARVYGGLGPEYRSGSAIAGIRQSSANNSIEEQLRIAAMHRVIEDLDED